MFKTLLFFAQSNLKDSAVYNKLFKEYEAVTSTDRSKAFTALNKIEKKSTAENNFYYLSEALVYKAILYYYDNNYDSAKFFINRSLALAPKGNNAKAQMRAYNLLGAIYYNQGDFKNTEKYYNEKIKVAEKNNDTAAIYGTYYNMGLVYFQQGNYLKSADYNFKALPYFERMKDTFNTISSLQSIGFTYMNLDDVPSSIKFYTKALSLARAYKDKYQLAGIYIDLAAAQGTVNKPDSELYYLDLALKLSSKEKDDFHFTIALNNKADHYLREKNYSQALILSKEAEKLNLKNDRKLMLCEVYSNISNVYYHLNKFDSALKYANKGYVMGVEVQQAKMVRLCAKTLAFIYEGKKNSDSALKYYKMYSAFNDTLKKESQLRGIAQKEFLLEKQNQETLRAQEKLLADTRLEKQKQINLIVIVASILLTIFLIIGVVNYSQKQKANALVLAQKKLLEEKQKEILDSINYASRIQNSLMPTDKYIEKSLKKLKP
ncbi:MAG: tetratricopeptide repeat protein [Bacteroidota bacterium]|nr:tetratricopeptide repeat protein [Bacteroidota bacterium]